MTKVWLSSLALLVFGIGWTSKALSDAGEPTPTSKEEARRERPSFFWKRVRDSRRSLLTVQSFARELELTEAQQAELSELTEQVAGRIRDHEHEIRGILESSRRAVDELLTAEQAERLAELIRRRRQQRDERRIRELLDSLRDEHGLELDEATERAVVAALTRQDGPRPGHRGRHGKPSERRSRSERFRQEIRSALAGLLDERAIELLTDELRDRSKGH